MYTPIFPQLPYDWDWVYAGGMGVDFDPVISPIYSLPRPIRSWDPPIINISLAVWD